MEMGIESSFVLQVVNMALLSMLIFTYVTDLSKKKSKKAGMTQGLLAFSVFLLVQNVMGIYLGFVSMNQMNEPFENYALFVNLMETVALLSLFWVTWK